MAKKREPDKVIKCSYCSQTFKTAEAKNIHMNLDH